MFDQVVTLVLSNLHHSTKVLSVVRTSIVWCYGTYPISPATMSVKSSRCCCVIALVYATSTVTQKNRLYTCPHQRTDVMYSQVSPFNWNSGEISRCCGAVLSRWMRNSVSLPSMLFLDSTVLFDRSCSGLVHPIEQRTIHQS